MRAMWMALGLTMAMTACDSGDADKTDTEPSDTETTDDTEDTEDTEESEASDTEDTEPQADLVNGEAVWTGTCANDYCHGSNTTVQDNAPTMTEAELYTQITAGGGYMPAQSDLSEDDVADVMAYIWVSFGGPA